MKKIKVVVVVVHGITYDNIKYKNQSNSVSFGFSLEYINSVFRVSVVSNSQLFVLKVLKTSIGFDNPKLLQNHFKILSYRRHRNHNNLRPNISQKGSEEL